MKLKDLSRLSTRMFKARTSRTFLTIFGMGVGMAAILFLVALGYGIQNTLLETITTSDSLLTLDVTPQKSDQKIGNDTVNTIKNISGVAEVSPVYETKAQIKSEDGTSDSNAIITDPGFFRLSGTKLEKGVGLDSSNGVVISSTFAKVFNKDPDDMVGQDIKLSLAFPAAGGKSTSFTDIETPFKISGYVDSADMIMYINSNDVKDGMNDAEFSDLKVKCSSSSKLEEVKSQIGSLGFSVSSLNDVVNQANKVFSIVRIILAFFGMVALAVSAIGMFNTMTVTLLERTEEIGIMKAIGAYNSNILSMFVFESTIMGLLGGFFGIVIAVTVGKILNIIINMIARHFGGYSITLFYYPLWFVLFILLSATVVGFITGLIPAKKASSIDPLDALRYK